MSSRFPSVPGWSALVAVGALAVIAPDVADAVRWVPFLLGLVLFALPHGAVDHHVPRRLGATAGVSFVAGYLAAVATGMVLWALAPLATLIAFLVVAALHWGAGDAWYARTVHFRAPFRGWRDAVLFVAARGALPVAVPALVHPGDLARGADAILGAVGAGSAPVLGSTVRTGGLVLVAALLAAAGVSALRAAHDRPRATIVDVGELILLAVFFIVTPAILAVGTYLIAWHAPRHIARLMACDPAQSALPTRRALIAWTREAAPLTVVALVGLAIVAAAIWRVPAATDTLAGAVLALIAALTFPHAALVAWMDRRQAVFSLAAVSAPTRHGSAARRIGGGTSDASPPSARAPLPTATVTGPV